MSSVDEIASQLERQLEDASRKIDDFVRSQNEYLAKAAADHDESMRLLEEKVARLASEEISAVAKLGHLHKELDGEKAALATAHAETARLEASTKTIPVEVDAARAAEAAARTALDAQRAEYERRESEVRFQLNELTKGVAFYKRLGLEFEKIHDDRLKLVFTLIDAARPDRKFCFNVRVAAADDYEVDGVEPPVPGVAEVVAELNTSNNFSAFVQHMRRRFQQFVAAEAAAGGAAAGGAAAGGGALPRYAV